MVVYVDLTTCDYTKSSVRCASVVSPLKVYRSRERWRDKTKLQTFERSNKMSRQSQLRMTQYVTTIKCPLCILLSIPAPVIVKENRGPLLTWKMKL